MADWKGYMPRRSKHPTALRGYEYRDQLRGPANPGMLIQVPGTFAVDFVVLDRRTAAQYAAVAELRIPLGACYYALTLDPPQSRPNLRLEIVGTLTPAADPLKAPVWVDRLISAAPVLVLVWRLRVWCRDSPLYVETLWSPTQRRTTAICGVEEDMSLMLMGGIREALTLLTDVRGAGRPWGTRYYDRERFFAEWPKKEAQARRRYGDPVRLKAIAHEYGVSYPTLMRYLHDYGRPPS